MFTWGADDVTTCTPLPLMACADSRQSSQRVGREGPRGRKREKEGEREGKMERERERDRVRERERERMSEFLDTCLHLPITLT